MVLFVGEIVAYIMFEIVAYMQYSKDPAGVFFF